MVGGLSIMAMSLRQRSVAVVGRLPLLTTSQSAPLQQGPAQMHTFVSKHTREPGYKRPAPFPYKEKTYNFFRAMLDDTTQRFDENSKIVVIDGPPTGNKDKFARQFADELDMHYISGAHLDAIYVNEYGHDIRKWNDKMPFSLRSFDISQFLQDPNHIHATRMQFQMMRTRFDQYIDAINHLLNTGQGVVMHRCIYSDIVFMETMAKLNYVTKTALDFYHEVMFQGMYHFIRPHVIIYLDISADQIIKNVKERDRPEERNSPLYTKEALTVMEEVYKEQYLRPMSEHCEVLVYDWSEEGEAEVVVEDICRIDFDKYDKYDKKLADWNFRNEWSWKEKRILFSDHREFMMKWLSIPRFPCPELIASAVDVSKYYRVIDKIPGSRYQFGFNKVEGDKFLFKM